MAGYHQDEGQAHGHNRLRHVLGATDEKEPAMVIGGGSMVNRKNLRCSSSYAPIHGSRVDGGAGGQSATGAQQPHSPELAELQHNVIDIRMEGGAG